MLIIRRNEQEFAGKQRTERKLIAHNTPGAKETNELYAILYESN